MDASTDPNQYNAVSERGIVISAVWISNKFTCTSYFVYLIFDSSISKNKRKNFWIVQIYNFPNAFCSRWRLSSGFGLDYDVILPADILPIPVMLPPIAVILSPVIF